MIKRSIQRVLHALRGLGYATKNDLAFRTQIYLSLVVAIIVISLFKTISATESLFILLACSLILITELQNSALESALNKLHPQLNEHIKHSKDMAAGAVLIAGLFLLVTLIVIGCGKL